MCRNVNPPKSSRVNSFSKATISLKKLLKQARKEFVNLVRYCNYPLLDSTHVDRLRQNSNSVSS